MNILFCQIVLDYDNKGLYLGIPSKLSISGIITVKQIFKFYVINIHTPQVRRSIWKKEKNNFSIHHLLWKKKALVGKIRYIK